MLIDNSPRLHACGAAINLPMLLVSLNNSGLHWRISPAQVVSLCICSLSPSKDEEKDLYELVPNFRDKYTLMGIPVYVDKTIYSQVIELRKDNEIIYTIDGLAIPYGIDSEKTQGD